MMTVGLFKHEEAQAPAPARHEQIPADDDVMLKVSVSGMYLTMGEWPRRARFDAALLLGRPRGLRWFRDTVDIRCANGRAIYKLEPRDGDTYHGVLAYSEGPDV